jgi:hypothetical protein
MPRKPKPKPITAWSFSRYACYQQCPALFKYRNIERRPEKKGPALLRGIEIHNDAEMYLKSPNPKKKKIPESLELFEEEFHGLVDNEAVAEESWGLTREWESTGFFDSDVWLRIKVDCYEVIDEKTLKLIDFKTGKVKTEGYEEQLELYAVGAFALFDIEEVHTELWFLDHGEIKGGEDDKVGVYTVDQYDDLVKTWEKRVQPMFRDTRYTPTPNFACQWCDHSKAHGGPCKF